MDSALSAVASVPTAGATSPLVHVELEQHRAVLTQVHRGSVLERGEAEVLEGCGSLALRQAAANHLASLFVRQARFDPLHAAETEQQLYSSLPAWLGKLDAWGEAELVLTTVGREHRVRLGRSELVGALEPLYSQLADRLVASLERLAAEPQSCRIGPAACQIFAVAWLKPLADRFTFWSGALP